MLVSSISTEHSVLLKNIPSTTFGVDLLILESSIDLKRSSSPISRLISSYDLPLAHMCGSQAPNQPVKIGGSRPCLTIIMFVFGSRPKTKEISCQEVVSERDFRRRVLDIYDFQLI